MCAVTRRSKSFGATLSVSSLLSEIGIAMVSIYLPLYSYLLGANEFVVGVIGAVTSITYIFASLFCGLLSYKFGTKITLLIGFTITSLTHALYFFIPQPILFIPIRALEGLGWSFIWPSLEALAGEDSSSLRAFNTMWGLGLTVAPAVGGILSQLTELTNVFLISSSLTALCFLLNILKLTRVQNKVIKERGADSSSKKIFTPSLFFYSFLYAFASSIILTFFPIYSNSKKIPISNVGYILTVMNFGRLLAFNLPVNMKKVSDERKTLPACVISVSFLSLLVFFSNLWTLFISLFISGFTLGLLYAMVQAHVITMAGEERRGYYASMFESILGVGFFFGPFCGGIVAGLSINYVFLLPLIFTIFFFFLTRIPRSLL
jgi:DHA1 family multidrug resistance protein-like MFS transporter